MSTYEQIKKLCDKKGIAITRLESELGFGRGSIGKLKNGKNTTADRLQKIADYFGISVEYFLNVPADGQSKPYYLDKETAEMAQELFDNPDLRILFDAARDAKPENLQLAAEMLRRFKETNPDG